MHRDEERHPVQRRKRVVVGGLVAALLITAGVVSGLVYIHTHSSPFPDSIRKQAKFTLFYPKALPTGWTVDTTSFSFDNGVAFYTLHGPAGKTIVASVQARPATFDFSHFYKENFKDPDQSDTPAGHTVLGLTSNRIVVGSLVGDDSWALLSPNSTKVSREDIRSILRHLQ